MLVAPLVFQAPEAPAAVCAGGRRPAREPSALRASLGASSRSPARPRHRPPAPRQIPPAPSTPAGPVILVCPARPRHRPRAPQPGQRGYRAPSNFACNSPVTLSRFELASLELQRFEVLLKFHAIELHAKFLVGVCVLTHGHCRQAPQPGPAAGPPPTGDSPDQQPCEHITRELRRSAPRNTMGPPPRRPRVVSGINQGKPP